MFMDTLRCLANGYCKKVPVSDLQGDSLVTFLNLEFFMFLVVFKLLLTLEDGPMVKQQICPSFSFSLKQLGMMGLK